FVARKLLRAGSLAAGYRAHLHALHERAGWRRRAGRRRAARGQGECALSSGLYRLAGEDAEFPRRRPADLCGPRRRGASFGDRLSGRCAMVGRRRGKGVVRAGEIPPVVPSTAERVAGGRAGLAHLRGSRLLSTTTKLSPTELKTALAREAASLGFDCIGVTDPGVLGKAGAHFRDFLEAGGHGDMDWLAQNPERRMDPRVLWPGVRSIVMLGVNYGPDENPLALLAKRTRGAISAY